jgi:hypothetical protein
LLSLFLAHHFAHHLFVCCLVHHLPNCHVVKMTKKMMKSFFPFLFDNLFIVFLIIMLLR